MKDTEYELLIRKAIPIAKARGDVCTFSDISYQREGARVWLRATRYSVLKQYSNSFALLIGPNASGPWLIYEERSIIRPQMAPLHGSHSLPRQCIFEQV